MLRTLLTLSLVVAAPLAAQGGKDPLSRAFTRWLRDYKAGRVPPHRLVAKSYLPKGMEDGSPTDPRERERWKRNYDRLREAARLFEALKERGTKEDGERFCKLVEASLHKKKQEGALENPTGKLSIFREKALAILAKGGCPPEIQDAVAERVRRGLSDGGGKADDGGTPKEHAEPLVASAFIPLLATFKTEKHRTLLGDLLHVAQIDVVLMSAQALAAMGYGPAVVEVARALHGRDEPDEVTSLAASAGELIRADSPKPKDKDLRYTLSVALDKLKSTPSWRSRIALVPLTRMVRSRSSIPVLIELLTVAKAAGMSKAKAAAEPWAGTLLKAINDALVDLTGAYFAPSEPEGWQAWWEGVTDEFELAKAKEIYKERKGPTKAVGFFGIPVLGSRVMFVVDISGSMEWPMHDKDYVSGETGISSRKKRPYESRLERLEKELIKAVRGMPPDASFNVTVFGGKTALWKKKLSEATPKNVKAFEKWVEKNLRAGGATPLFDGLELALGEDFEQHKFRSRYVNEIDELFVLSDGAPNRGRLTVPREILDAVRRWNRTAQVRIHTVYLGDTRVDDDLTPPGAWKPPADQLEPEEFMRRLAAENHGRFQEPAKSR